MTEKGATALVGELPNMSGGVLSTNPIGASGMLRFAEAAMQVRGQAGSTTSASSLSADYGETIEPAARGSAHEVERLAARQIGIVSDTHDEVVAWDELQPRIEAALDGVDLVLHCGDLTTPVVLDLLETIAPVRAVRSPADPPPDPPRLVEGPRRLEVNGATLLLANARPAAGAAEDANIVVFGGTHEAMVETVGGVLYVNPGSPSLAERTSVAILDLTGSKPDARITPVS